MLPKPILERFQVALPKAFLLEVVVFSFWASPFCLVTLKRLLGQLGGVSMRPVVISQLAKSHLMGENPFVGQHWPEYRPPSAACPNFDLFPAVCQCVPARWWGELKILSRA